MKNGRFSSVILALATGNWRVGELVNRILGRSLAVCLMGSLAQPASAQPPMLEAVLERAGRYVVEFQRQLSGIVAEEHYVQDVRMTLPTATGRLMSPPALSHRVLISDFLLVRPAGADRWVEFRDVFD